MDTQRRGFILFDMARMIFVFITGRIKLAFRRPTMTPMTQQQLADLVNCSIRHEIRAGYTHRFIEILFVTVNERVFCRRYTYNEPSWYSAFAKDPAGQVKLDKTIIDVNGHVPPDLDEINPLVDKAYEAKLKQLGASYMLAGATEARAQASTFEVILANDDKPEI